MPTFNFGPRKTVYNIRQKLPKHCTLCRIFIPSYTDNRPEISLCEPCLQALPAIETVCASCGLPFALAVRTKQPQLAKHGPQCGRCLKTPPHYDAFLAALPYVAPVSGLITEFKYSARFDRGRLLAGLLATQIIDSGAIEHPPNCLLPVPLHWRRQLSRGFNQSVLLASYLRADLLAKGNHPKHCALPLNTRLLRRKVHTLSQTQQKMNARHDNVKGAFSVQARRKLPRHVAIIDDVVTTGATVNEISRMLKTAGVQRVSVWAIARTPAE